MAARGGGVARPVSPLCFSPRYGWPCEAVGTTLAPNVATPGDTGGCP